MSDDNAFLLALLALALWLLAGPAEAAKPKVETFYTLNKDGTKLCVVQRATSGLIREFSVCFPKEQK